MEKQFKLLQQRNAKLLVMVEEANDTANYYKSLAQPIQPSNPSIIPNLKAEIFQLKTQIQEMGLKDYSTITIAKMEKIAHENQRENAILKHEIEQLKQENTNLSEQLNEFKQQAVDALFLTQKSNQINTQLADEIDTLLEKTAGDEKVVSEVELVQNKMISEIQNLSLTISKQSQVITSLSQKYDKQELEIKQLYFDKMASSDEADDSMLKSKVSQLEQENQQLVLQLEQISKNQLQEQKSVIHDEIFYNSKDLNGLEKKVVKQQAQILNLQQEIESIPILNQIISNLKEKSDLDDQQIIQIQQQNIIFKQQIQLINNDIIQ